MVGNVGTYVLYRKTLRSPNPSRYRKDLMHFKAMCGEVLPRMSFTDDFGDIVES